MTKEECLSKIEELKKIAFAQLDKRIDHILWSGFIDLEAYQNNYLLPKMVLCASLHYAAKQLEPYSKKGNKELKNLNLV